MNRISRKSDFTNVLSKNHATKFPTGIIFQYFKKKMPKTVVLRGYKGNIFFFKKTLFC